VIGTNIRKQKQNTQISLKCCQNYW
jgi:hypothetical protein